MEITLGQQYKVGEKPTVILYTYINRHAGTPEKTLKTKQRQCSTTSSHMIVIIYYYIGYKYKATTWYLAGFPNGSNLLGQQYNVGEKPTVIYIYICEFTCRITRIAEGYETVHWSTGVDQVFLHRGFSFIFSC